MTARIIWRGIEIEVRHEQNWLDTDFDHIEVEATPRTPLPFTETGYRSHFMRAEELSRYESPSAFVLAWLNAEAGDWDAQLSMF
jgi:hypothetical protein